MKIANGFNRLTIFPKKDPSQMLGWIPNAPPIAGVVNVGGNVNWKYMEFAISV